MRWIEKSWKLSDFGKAVLPMYVGMALPVIICGLSFLLFQKRFNLLAMQTIVWSTLLGVQTIALFRLPPHSAVAKALFLAGIAFFAATIVAMVRFLNLHHDVQRVTAVELYAAPFVAGVIFAGIGVVVHGRVKRARATQVVGAE